MQSADRPHDPFAALNARELTVLHLLASGHTIKTIATQLGCSEASVNERLRDARRKTGMGSSRELARLLDAQKIWDNKIGLPMPTLTANTGASTAISRSQLLKGVLVMLGATSIAVIGLIAVTAPSTQPITAQVAPAAAAARSPLDGKWTLDVARIPESERPQQVTIAFGVASGRWTTRVNIIGSDGANVHADSTAAVDGVPVPISGNLQFADTVALRQPAPNTLVMTLAKAGVPVSTRVYTVAKDRRTMTETIIWSGQAMPKLETTTFKRME